MIARLPVAITLPTVLDRVKGGAILSAQLLDSVKLTRFMTVRVVFVEGLSAVSYKDHAKKHPLEFNGVTSKVTLVSTPTWPAKFNPNHTRRLEVQGLPPFVTPLGLQQTIGHVLNHPIRMEKLDSGNIVLEFTSIDKAGYAYEVLRRTYRGCRPHFISDPCAQPLETLLSAVPATSSSTAKEAATCESLETRDSLDDNPNSPPDARSYSSGLGPSLLDTANPEELDAVYRPLLPW